MPIGSCQDPSGICKRSATFEILVCDVLHDDYPRPVHIPRVSTIRFPMGTGIALKSS